MVNIYETEGGKLNALQDFEEGCWVKVTAATMWEMEPVAKKYNIDIEDSEPHWMKKRNPVSCWKMIIRWFW